MSLNSLIYPAVYILGVIISAFAQIMLKKSTDKNKLNIVMFIKKYTPKLYISIMKSDGKLLAVLKRNKTLVFDYLNIITLMAYMIFFTATFLTIFAYKGVPLSAAPILGSTEYIFIAILSRIFLKEDINRKKLLGLIVIVTGIIVYSY